MLWKVGGVNPVTGKLVYVLCIHSDLVGVVCGGLISISRCVATVLSVALYM